jgi:hypothetical protein
MMTAQSVFSVMTVCVSLELDVWVDDIYSLDTEKVFK